MGNAVVNILREELAALCDNGCQFVQFDEPVLTEVALAGPNETHTFMCAALSEKSGQRVAIPSTLPLVPLPPKKAGEGTPSIRINYILCINMPCSWLSAIAQTSLAKNIKFPRLKTTNSVSQKLRYLHEVCFQR